jgi:hypothetical protein
LGAAILDLLLDLGVTLVILATVCLAVAWTLLKGWRPLPAVLAGSLTKGLFSMGLFFLGLAGGKEGALAAIQKYFDPAQFESDWTKALQVMSEKGLDTQKLLPFKEFIEKYIYFASPAMEAFWCLVWGLLAYYAVSAFLNRITTRIPRASSFRVWIVPEPLIFGLITAGLLKMVAKENGWIDILGDNLVVFFLGLYTLGSLSIISFFFYKWRLPAMLRILGYAFVFLFSYSLIWCLGVLDVWFDFRRIKSPPPEVPHESTP